MTLGVNEDAATVFGRYVAPLSRRYGLFILALAPLFLPTLGRAGIVPLCPPTATADADPGDTDGPDFCTSFSFYVPPVPPGQRKTLGKGGWGFLVLTFNEAVDGGAFSFLPACSTPKDARINPNNPNQLAFGPGNYGLGATGAQAENQPPGTNYGTLNVTIVFDINEGVGGVTPSVVSGYWKSKPNDTASPLFTFTPNAPRYYDVKLTPEPSSLLTVLGGVAMAFVLRIRRCFRKTST